MIDEEDKTTLRAIVVDALGVVGLKIDELGGKIGALEQRIERVESASRDDLAETRACRAKLDELERLAQFTSTTVQAIAQKLGCDKVSDDAARKPARGRSSTG